jgi:hypothetical protein
VFGSAIKERVTANNERACLLLGQVPKYGIDVAVGAGIQDLQLQSDCAGRRPHIFRYGGGTSAIGWIDERGDICRFRDQLVRQVQPLRS